MEYTGKIGKNKNKNKKKKGVVVVLLGVKTCVIEWCFDVPVGLAFCTQ